MRHPENLSNILGLSTKFQLKLTIFISWSKFTQKWYFRSKMEKWRSSKYQDHLNTKFRLKLKILIIWSKFTQKWHFRLKRVKLSITIKFYIFHLVYVTNFSLNWQLCFFEPNLPKNDTFGLKQKNCVFACVHGR